MTASTTAAAIVTAAIAGAVAITKKLLPHKAALKPEYITRAEFHESLDSMRDRIGAGHLSLSDKIDANHKELLTAIAHQGETFERRIDQLETSLARIDERTKL
jgi:hypothetical protein